MYSEEVIDHSRYPRNQGKLKDYDYVAIGANASCGDEVKIYMKLSKGKVEKIGVESSGCALSTAAASMLSEMMIGKTMKEIGEIEYLEIESLMGRINPGRIKCVRLPIDALREIKKVSH